MLYSNNSAIMVLGHLLNKPRILINDKYKLHGEDFSNFHRIIFWAIRNIAAQGAKEIDEVAVDMFLQNEPSRYEVAKKNDFIGFVRGAKSIAVVDDFDYHYMVVKKYSLLRYYKDNGFNIKPIYDENNDSKEKLEEYEIEEIVEYFDKIQATAKKEYLVNSDVEEIKAGYKMHDIVDEFSKVPMFGASTPSLYMNTITRGLIKGQYNVISCPSGVGKSTWALSNIALIGCPVLYDKYLNEWVDNPCFCNESVLYIDYEMNQLRETSPKLLASISQVPTTHILNGTYLEGERERVDKAVDILYNDSNIYMVNMPNFTISAINSYVEDYVLNHNVGYLFFDYISEQASINSEVATKNKVSTRSDMVLSTMSSALKDIAVRFGICVCTYTQTNANIWNQDVLDSSCIAGSRAVVNKCDYASIMMPIRPKEVEIGEMIYESQKQSDKTMMPPNRIIHLHKVRFGSYESNLKIWIYLDLSTGLVQDCWVTDKDDNLLPPDRAVEKTNLYIK